MKRTIAYGSLTATLLLGLGTAFGQTATPGTCYATRSASHYELYSIDLSDASADSIGETGSIPLPGLAVDSKGQLYATSSATSGGPFLFRVDATTGVAQQIGSTAVGRAVDGIDFDHNDHLYGADDDLIGNGTLVLIDTTDASVDTVGHPVKVYAGLAFDPTDGTLYGSTGGLYDPDIIATIDKGTGTDTEVGVTGLGGATPDIAFDASGNLYGLKGGGKGVASKLISINKSTGVAVEVGTVATSSGPVTNLTGFTCYNPTDDGGEPIVVHVDIKPQACPNQINTKAKAKVNVAILGTADFDVTEIDPASLTLAGLSPSSWSVLDVSRPPLDDGPCACTTDGPDGYPDLQLKFDNQEIVSVLGDVEDGDELTLDLSGALFDDTEISGQDCIVVQVPAAKAHSAGLDVQSNQSIAGAGEAVPAEYALESNYPNPFNPTTSIGFVLAAESHVELSVYNALGKRVATLVSSTLPAGRHIVEWNATDDQGRKVSTGLYIYRIAAGEFVQSQKMLLLE